MSTKNFKVLSCVQAGTKSGAKHTGVITEMNTLSVRSQNEVFPGVDPNRPGVLWKSRVGA